MPDDPQSPPRRLPGVDRLEQRAESRRWRLQHELMKTDLESGIDRRILELVRPAPASSHDLRVADGTRIAYKRFGDRGPVLLLCNGLGGTYRTFGDVIARLLPDVQFLVADYRGLFESGESAVDDKYDIATHAADLVAVCDHAGVSEFTLFGWSMGVQVSLEIWRLARERVRGMILTSGVDGRLLEHVAPIPAAGPLVRGFVRGMREWGGTVSHLLGRTVRSEPVARVARALNLVGRNAETTMEHAALLFSTEPRVYWRIVEYLDEHDASDLLDGIDAPVLVLHGDSDMLTPVHKGRELRLRIPDSEIWVFAGCTHAVILEYPERVARHVREFMHRRVDSQVPLRTG